MITSGSERNNGLHCTPDNWYEISKGSMRNEDQGYREDLNFKGYSMAQHNQFNPAMEIRISS